MFLSYLYFPPSVSTKGMANIYAISYIHIMAVQYGASSLFCRLFMKISRIGCSLNSAPGSNARRMDGNASGVQSMYLIHLIVFTKWGSSVFGRMSITILHKALYMRSLFMGVFSSKRMLKGWFFITSDCGKASFMRNNSGSPWLPALTMKLFPTTVGTLVVFLREIWYIALRKSII